jgi:hypothetical protein
MRPRLRSFPTIPIIALAAFASAAFAAVTTPVGGLRRDALADYAPELKPGKTHNEFWTWQFLFDGGTQAQLNLSRVHFGSLKDPVCGADFALMNFRGRNHYVAREYPLSNFFWDAGQAVLRTHANIWTEGLPPRSQHVHFATRKDGKSYFLDLTLEKMTPGVVWGDGVFRLSGGEKVSLFMHVPRARVRGRIAIDEDTVEVKGFAWMDHSRQTQFGTRFMDAGYRYVVTEGRAEGGYFFQDGGTVFGYGVREEGGGLALLKPVGLAVSERGSWGGLSVPKLLDISLDGRGPLRLRRTEDRQRTSVLQELGSFERLGARVYLGGEIFGVRGLARVDDSLPAVYSFTMVKK